MHKVKVQYVVQEIRIAVIEVSESELETLTTSKILSSGFNDDREIMQKLEKNKTLFHQHKFYDLEGVEIQK